MIWKTGLTPTPVPPSPALTSPTPRPVSAYARPPSARPPSTMAMTRPRTATPCRSATPARPATPVRPETPYDPAADEIDEELEKISCRNPTPIGHREPTPNEFDPNSRDLLASAHPHPEATKAEVGLAFVVL